MEASPNHAAVTVALRWHVDRLADLIGPRHLGKPASLEAARKLIEQELSQAGYRVQQFPYQVGGQHTVVNLVAEIPGVKRPNEIVVLGAHYDTVATTPGADDNASAVAALIEIAKLARNWRPARTIRFVAFPCEEPPYSHTQEMGSQVYARRSRQLNEKIVGMLCLEMVGYYRQEKGGQAIPSAIPRIFRWAFPRRANFLAAVGNPRSARLLWKFRRGFKKAVRFPLFTIVLPELIRDIRRSDNSSFWDQGYPALMLTDTSYLRNPHYHLPTDMPNTLDYDSMTSVAFGVAGGLAYIAGVR